MPGLSVSTDVIYEDSSFILTDDVTVHSGGRLTLDNTTVLVRMQADLDVEIRVEAGGELRIVNGSRIISTFSSVGFSLHYMVFIEPGGHLVFRDSTIDTAYAVGVGDETAIIENVTISNTLLGLYGANLTVDGARFFGNTIGFWVSGNSILRDIDARGNEVYAGILDGTSRLEGGDFLDSTVGDLQLLENSSAANTTHHRSARAFILNGNVSIDTATVSGAIYGAIQLGDRDFRYGCGIFNGSIPESDWLNLHLFPIYYRVNNTVRLKDLEVFDSAAGILFAQPIWRRALTFADEYIDDCVSDPDPPVPAEPLFNNIAWTITRPTSVVASHNEFNGTIEVQPGGSLHLEGGDFVFIGTGDRQRLVTAGTSLTFRNTHLMSAFANYSSDALEFGRAVAPGIDIDVQAGSLEATNVILQNLGSDADRSVPSGLVVRSDAGPVRATDVIVNESTRGFVIGCCAPAAPQNVTTTLDRVTLEGTTPLLELWNVSTDVYNSTLAAGGAPSIWSSAGSSRVALYSTEAVPAGPGDLTLEHYGFLESRVVWPDLRPVVGATLTAVDTVTGQEWANFTTDDLGWVPFSFVRYLTTTWDGAMESAGSPHPFALTASHGNVSSTIAPVDLSQPGLRTLILPDAGAPEISLAMPAVFFTNKNFGTVNGSVQDHETGVSLVEFAVDSGAFTRVTPPGPPAVGLLNFSKSYSGLAPGIHALTFRAWDTVGNSAQASVFVVVDPLPPSLHLDQGLNITTNTRDFNLTGRLSEPGTVTVANRSVSVTEDQLWFSIPYHLATDSVVLQIHVVDIAGNEATHPLVVRLDQTPPELTLTSPADGAYVSNPDLLLRGTVEPTATVYLNGVRLGISGSTSFSIPAALSEGENALELLAVDMAGNEATVRFTVTLDTGVPPLDILGPDTSRPFADGEFDIVLRTEPGATVTIENTTVVAADPVVRVPYSLPNGRHSLSIEVTDKAGNLARRGLTVTIDTTVPTLSVSGGDNQSTPDDTYRLIGQTEPGAYVRVGQWEAQADDLGVFALTMRLHAGKNTVPILAWDLAGNQAQTTVTIWLDQPDPAAPAGIALPTVGTLVLLVMGVLLVMVAAPIARRVAHLLP